MRQLLGYEEIVGSLDELLEIWSEWNNLYSATMKQEWKKREGGRLIRRHEKRPMTPGQRLIEYWRKEGEEEKARSMERQMRRCDPIEMKEEIEKRLKQVWEMKESLEATEAEEERRGAPRADAFRSVAQEGIGPGKKRKQEPKRQRAKRSPLNRVS